MTPADPKRTEDTEMDIPDFVVETLARAYCPKCKHTFPVQKDRPHLRNGSGTKNLRRKINEHRFRGTCDT